MDEFLLDQAGERRPRRPGGLHGVEGDGARATLVCGDCWLVGRAPARAGHDRPRCVRCGGRLRARFSSSPAGPPS